MKNSSFKYNAKVREKLALLRPIDDQLFEKLVEDREVCQEILQVILEDKDLKVIEVVPQNSIKNLLGRSVRLDALCELGTGEKCNIEVQKADDDNHVRRVRYNASCITANMTKPGTNFENIPNIIMIYIAAFDIFGEGDVVYYIDKVIRGKGKVIDDGVQELYINATGNDDSKIAELMQCFLQEKVNNSKFPKLSSKMHYYKEDEKGAAIMCKIIEEYANEVALENIRNLFKNGCSVDVVIKSFENISEELIRAIYEEVAGNKTRV